VSLTEPQAHHRDQRRPRLIVIRDNHAPRDGLDSKAAEVIARDVFAFGDVRLAFYHHVEFIRTMVGKHTRKQRIVLLEELKSRVRKDAGDVTELVIVVGGAAHGVEHGRASHASLPA
jgi:hypothetical protein